MSGVWSVTVVLLALGQGSPPTQPVRDVAVPVTAPVTARVPAPGAAPAFEPAAVDPRWLAPTPVLLAEEARSLEHKLMAAEAVAEAVVRLQNRIAERLAVGAVPCADPETRQWVARARLLGSAWRDAAQAARAQSDRVEHLSEAPTVAPLLDDVERARLDKLRRRAERTGRLFLEARAWQRQHVNARARPGAGGAECPAEPSPGPGVPGPSTKASGVAVIGVGGGRICPVDVPSEGVVLLPKPKACYARGPGCDCTPEPVLPAAVLGPSD